MELETAETQDRLLPEYRFEDVVFFLDLLILLLPTALDGFWPWSSQNDAQVALSFKKRSSSKIDGS